ncbi:hypothetical protein SDC9_96478 [bioreactor metagenome]|uniref:Lipoprotein n=1 Tax=bioreactor metagenome TaxID=1076179 RepID=A0A645A9T0_9ZZZZ
MKRTAAIIIILLLILVAFSACNPSEANPPKTEASDKIVTISTPEFFNDIGKTLNTLKKEHPRAEIITRDDGLPDAAAICFGEPDGKYSYYFFGTQSGDIKEVMDGYGDQLKCAGFLTTADVFFPEMKDNMSFSDFFSLIGVSDYEYDSEEGCMQGVLDFKYNNMKVWLNTCELTTGGGREFTGIETVKKSAPVAIIDEKIDSQNDDLADAVMFDGDKGTVPAS